MAAMIASTIIITIGVSEEGEDVVGMSAEGMPMSLREMISALELVKVQLIMQHGVFA